MDPRRVSALVNTGFSDWALTNKKTKTLKHISEILFA